MTTVTRTNYMGNKEQVDVRRPIKKPCSNPGRRLQSPDKSVKIKGRGGGGSQMLVSKQMRLNQ